MSETTTDLATLAAECWVMMTRAEEQCPPAIAFDLLRIRAGETDDVPALKLAVYGAAGSAVPKSPRVDFDMDDDVRSTVTRVSRFISDGARLFAANAVRDLRDRWAGYVEHARHYAHEVVDEAREIIAWCDKADAALALCRAIENLPE